MIWHHVAILARNPERTLGFYVERLGFSVESRGFHQDDPATEEVVLSDWAQQRLVFHFYPRSHRGRPGRGGVRELYLTASPELWMKLKGTRVRRFGQDYISTKDPDGLQLLVKTGPRVALLGLAVISSENDFWSRLWGVERNRWEDERLRLGSDDRFLEVANASDDEQPSLLGFGSVHHVALREQGNEAGGGLDLSVSKPNRFGTSRYTYSPCGLLCEVVAS